MHFFSVNCVLREKYQPLVLGFHFFPTKRLYSIRKKSLMEIHGRIVQSWNNWAHFNLQMLMTLFFKEKINLEIKMRWLL